MVTVMARAMRVRSVLSAPRPIHCTCESHHSRLPSGSAASCIAVEESAPSSGQAKTRRRPGGGHVCFRCGFGQEACSPKCVCQVSLLPHLDGHPLLLPPSRRAPIDLPCQNPHTHAHAHTNVASLSKKAQAKCLGGLVQTSTCFGMCGVLPCPLILMSTERAATVTALSVRPK